MPDSSVHSTLQKPSCTEFAFWWGTSASPATVETLEVKNPDSPQGLPRRDATPWLSTHLHQDKGPLQQHDHITNSSAMGWQSSLTALFTFSYSSTKFCCWHLKCTKYPCSLRHSHQHFSPPLSWTNTVCGILSQVLERPALSLTNFSIQRQSCTSHAV